MTEGKVYTVRKGIYDLIVLAETNNQFRIAIVGGADKQSTLYISDPMTAEELAGMGTKVAVVGLNSLSDEARDDPAHEDAFFEGVNGWARDCGLESFF